MTTTKRRRYTKQQKLAAVVTAELTNATAAAESLHIPETTIRYWLDRPEFVALRAKTREEDAAGFAVLMRRSQERLFELIPTMDARDLTILLGVASDKAQLLSGQATERVEARDLSDVFEDHEKAALRKAIDEATRAPV